MKTISAKMNLILWLATICITMTITGFTQEPDPHLWLEEVDNPKALEWAYIRKYSPCQNVKSRQSYPEVFFTTSTRDDRVHPGHARKMVARMNELGYPVYYFENTEGGHAGASTNEQRARMQALIYTYLQMKLMNQ